MKIFKCISFLLLVFMLTSVAYSQKNPLSDSNENQLALVLLMDASGSMKQNDPNNIRKSAAKVISSMLSQKDRVAIIQFGEKGETLTEGGITWFQGDERNKIYTAINRIANNQRFTDFRSGLESAKQVLSKEDNSRRKVIVLLSDGILEPNPADETYKNNINNYGQETGGKIGSFLTEARYRELLSPVAERIISEEIIPALKKDGVEIFTVGLSPNVDKKLLSELAEETNLHPMESHSFYAERATDVSSIFTLLLQYWTDMAVIRDESGQIQQMPSNNVFIDKYYIDPMVVTLMDGNGQFKVRTESGSEEDTLLVSDKQISVRSITRQRTPGNWTYGFESGTGTYRVVWAVRNLLKINVDGLKETYNFGDTVSADVRLNAGEKPDNPAISPQTFFQAKIWGEGLNETVISINQINNKYRLNYIPTKPGIYNLQLTAFAKNIQGDDILPRPSIIYRWRVNPAFYVNPEKIKLGSFSKGKKIMVPVEIHHGLEHQSSIGVSGAITRSSNLAFDNTKGQYAAITATKFAMAPGEVTQNKVEIVLPENKWWKEGGDYVGMIYFQTSSGERASIEYRFHMQTFWELGVIVIALLIVLGILIIGYLAYIWGSMVNPHGILIPLSSPMDEVATPIYLSELNRNILTKWLSYNRNHLQISNKSSSDIRLASLPEGLSADIYFYRFIGTFLRNTSVSAELSITIQEEGLGVYDIYQKNSLSIRDGSIITIGEYQYRYQNSNQDNT